MDNMDELKEQRDDKGKFIDKTLVSIYKRRVGQPKKFRTPEALAFKAIEYFEWCIETKNKVTFAGLRVFVDFSRENWSDYKNNYPEYFDTIRHIEQMLEAEWESKLGWAGSTQGAIFWLKNKAGWKDQQDVNQTVTNLSANFGTAIPTTQQPGDNTQGDK